MSLFGIMLFHDTQPIMLMSQSDQRTPEMRHPPRSADFPDLSCMVSRHDPIRSAHDVHPLPTCGIKLLLADGVIWIRLQVLSVATSPTRTEGALGR